MKYTKKHLWRTQHPGYHQKTLMLKNCGKQCFLGTKKSFPVCKKNTCSISKLGIMAAYKRAKEYVSISRTKGRSTKRYSRIANQARRML